MNVGYVGYVILSNGKDEIKMKSCILKNAFNSNLLYLIDYNLCQLNRILDYNIKHNIHLFRISSGIIPFGSHPINDIRWWDVFRERFREIGRKAKENDIRLSMHPGQYTTLSSPNSDIINKSIDDLIYHTRVLDALNLDYSSKLILHIGGIYDSKEMAIKRFVKNFKRLPKHIQNRIIIENDDKCYTVEDILKIHKLIRQPVVFDYLHYELNHQDDGSSFDVLLKKCRRTWKKKDGIQKIHYSQQNENKPRGAHSLSINPRSFYELSQKLPSRIDVMFEVKDKNKSVIKYYNYLKRL